ncbi:ROK family protein [Pedobacter chinensis]|uniref:ROK family protein n=1 Tax=Pedobacter chinensis TaxID=2282421 RepID=UPI0013141356|nr:ROK family protein [Pedobacter chinensis]
MKKNIILGVDIGGSHITSALVDVTSGQIIEGSWKRERIDSQSGAEAIIAAWCTVMQDSLLCAEHSGKIAIAMPGPFDYTKGISYMKGMGKFDALYEQNVRALILGRLSKVASEVYFINDAGCFLQGEITHGEASKYKKVMGFTIGTGFGSASGNEGVATDADYWQYPFLGGICEDFFSSKWFVSKYVEYSGKLVINVKDLIENADNANPLFQIFDEFSINLGTFLARIFKDHHFECVVLGGNISKASPLFLPQLQYHLKVRSMAVPIIISKKGENAALIGAACSI